MLRRFACALLLLTIGGCRLKPVERPYPPPRLEDVMAALRANEARISSLRADTKIEHLEGGQRVKLTVGLLLARPDKLRFEAQAPLTGAVATLVTNGDRFALLDVRNNRFLMGPAKACN